MYALPSSDPFRTIPQYFFSSWPLWCAKSSQCSFCNILTKLLLLPRSKIDLIYNASGGIQIIDEKNQYLPFFYCLIQSALETRLLVSHCGITYTIHSGIGGQKMRPVLKNTWFCIIRSYGLKRLTFFKYNRSIEKT